MKNNKKLVSWIAALALSATAVCGAASITACNGDSSASGKSPVINSDVNTISTASGEVQIESSGKTYYVAPNGTDSADGSETNPYNIFYLLSSETILQPGDTVLVQPGTYEMTATITMRASGACNKYITIKNASTTGEKAVLDFSKQFFASTSRGVQIYGNYVYWYGIDICGAGDNGMYIGGSYNTIEYCEFYNNRDTGLQLGRQESSHSSITQWPSYNLIKNCTSHNNYDNETYGENADGFAAKLTVGYGNVFDGCIAYRNSDDGWDLYAKSDSGNIGCVIIYNCVAFENGYIEYTQRENNARFPTWANNGGIYSEDPENVNGAESYLTRDGDGNGFKLGGSVMEGDVAMYNCLSFGNRMHGVTDNSNPGVLVIEGVTSYDNSAAIDNNPSSDTFGQIIAASNYDVHGNIDVARQTYSYNILKDILSVGSGLAPSLDSDAYRGSVTDSILYAKGAKANVISGSMDADTKTGKSNTSQVNALVAADVFKTLPVTCVKDAKNNNVYTYNISGLKDLGSDYVSGAAVNQSRIHHTYRNADGSINMHEILAVKDYSILLGADKVIGSVLDKTSWADYTHFYANDFALGESETDLVLQRAKEALTLNCNEDAVYQDFEIPAKLINCTVTWTSSDTSVLAIDEEYLEVSLSGSEYNLARVYRSADEDKTVTLTATITLNGTSVTKVFELTVKKGVPVIGGIYVLTQDGSEIRNGGALIIDQFSICDEPEVRVENGLDYNGKLLTEDQYEIKTTYKYAADKNSHAVEVKGFTPSKAGVYTITHQVNIVGGDSKGTMSYTVYVASASAQVDFDGAASLLVNRDGFIISGGLTSATGTIYALTSRTEISDLTGEALKSAEGVQTYTFRNNAISFQFADDNNSEYYIYYALANLNGEVTSKVYSTKVNVVNISTTEEFMKIAGGKLIGSEVPTETVYMLTADLDFTDVTWSAGNSAFTGLLNGAGHTVSNVTVNGSGDGAGIFSKVDSATIENIKFSNVTIASNGKQVGVIATSYGGYFHNIVLNNVSVTGNERVGGLIGQAFENELPTYISNVSVVNDEEHKITSGTGKRAGGIIGLIQTTSAPSVDFSIYISDCYVIADISGLEQVAGIVGSFDNAKTNIDYYLEIARCYFGGTASTTYTTPRVSGIIGYQSGNVGYFRIEGCISVGRIFNQGVEITAAQKTASLIVGGFSSSAVNVVKNCIAAMEEYNSDYDVAFYTESNLKANPSAFANVLGMDIGTTWTVVYESDGVTLTKPYLVLNFLGEWDN